MGVFMVYTFKVAICLLLFFIFNKLFLSRDTFHTFNRVMWLLILVASLLVPFLEWSDFNFKSVENYIAYADVDYIGVSSVIMLPEEQGSFDLFPIVKYSFITYIVVVVALILRLGISYVRLFSLILPKKNNICKGDESLENKSYLELLDRCKSVVGVRKKVRFIVHDKEVSPFSWMSYIVISKADLDGDGREIIIHELSHIKRRHSWDLFFADLLTIFQWFNPAAWLYKQALQQVHEYEADESVLCAGVNAKQYQLLLIKKAVGQRFYSMSNSFNHSKLKNRITMMLKEKSNKWATAKCLYALPLALLAVSAFANPEVSDRFDDISSVKVTQNSVNNDVLSENPTSKDGDNLTLIVIKVKEANLGDVKEAVRDLANKDLLEHKLNYGKGIISAFLKEGVRVTDEIRNPIEKAGGSIVEKIDVMMTMNGKTSSPASVIDDISVKLSEDANGDVIGVQISHNEEPSKKTNKDDDVVVVGYGKMSNPEKSITEISLRLEGDIKYPLIVVNGKVYDGEVSDFSPERIKNINVLKGESAIKAYGENAKNGAIEITMKSGLPQNGDENGVKVVGFGKMDDSAECKVSTMFIRTSDGGSIENALIIVDGKKFEGDMGDISPETIESISVLKDEAAITIYGESAKNGAVVIVTKKATSQGVNKDESEVVVVGYGTEKKTSNETNIRVRMSDEDLKDVLVIIDGEKSENGMNAITPDMIKSMSVLKDEAAIATYGKRAKNGVVLIVTKGATSQDKNKPVLVAETMPMFKGGTIADFSKWVLMQIKYPEEAAKKKITGRVLARFVIEKNGKLSSIDTFESPDILLSQEVERIIKSSPKWTPGEQDGEKVRVQIIIPVNFQLQE